MNLKKKLSGQNVTTQSLNDLTRPAFPIEIGSRHPVSLIKNRIIEVFANIGFNIAEGPEIEDDWHNFTALNLPEYHPARDMQDTFFIQTRPDILLHTHTSLWRFATWNSTNLLFVSLLLAGCTAMRTSRHALTVSSTK